MFQQFQSLLSRTGIQRTFVAALIPLSCVVLASREVGAGLYTWVGAVDGTGVWSASANWLEDGINTANIPGAADTVSLAGTDSNALVDQAFTIANLTMTGNGATDATTTGPDSNLGGTGPLVVTGTVQSFNQNRVVSVPLSLTGNLAWVNSGAHQRGAVSSLISGTSGISFSGTDQLAYTNNNTFTGGFEIQSGFVRSQRSNGTALGRGPISLGAQTGGSSNATLDFTFTPNGAYGANNVTLTVESGTGARNVSLGSGSSYTLALDWVLEKDLDFNVNAASALVLSGDISGAGGITLRDSAPSSMSLTISGSNTYTGDTLIEDTVAVTLTGSLGTANIEVDGGSLEGGSGTINYNINGGTSDLMTLTSGTLDLSNLTIDFDELGAGATADSYVVVDYSAGGSLITAINPATDDTFLFALNIPSGYELLNNTSDNQILLVQPVVPEPSSFALLGLGALGLVRTTRRRRRVGMRPAARGVSKSPR